jgi:hypothetical protein
MARSTTTVQQILADARMLCGAESYTEIREETLLVRYNLVMPEIYKRLNSALVSRFFDSAPIGTPAGGYVATAADNLTWTAATKRLTIGAGFSTSRNGDLVMIVRNPGQSAEVYLTHITNDQSGSGYIVVDSGPSVDIAAGSLVYIVLNSPAASPTTHSIQDHRVDRIRRMHFTLAGVGIPRDEDVVEAAASIPYYKPGVVWTQSGTGSNAVIKKYAGASTVNSGGFPVMFFDGLPRPAEAVSEYVELDIEFHSVLIEEIARRTLLQIKKPIPPSLENPMAAIDAITKAGQ